MCLMCMYYLDTCYEEECFEDARAGRPLSEHGEAYEGRSGSKIFLWQWGEPCKHIAAKHESDCEIFNPEDRWCSC